MIEQVRITGYRKFRELTFTPHPRFNIIVGDNVHPRDVDAYVAAFKPLPLRWSKSTAKAFDHLEFMNFGAAKGLTRKRVLVFPTAKMEKLLQQGRALEDSAAAHLYVAVTRAEQSVAFAISDAGHSKYKYWSPHRP